MGHTEGLEDGSFDGSLVGINVGCVDGSLVGASKTTAE